MSLPGSFAAGHPSMSTMYSASTPASQHFGTDEPPPPPPKPSSHETSRIGTPLTGSSLPQPPPPPPPPPDQQLGQDTLDAEIRELLPETPSSNDSALPEDGWIPEILKDKSKGDLSYVLHSPALIDALTHAPSTAHSSVIASESRLEAALDANMQFAKRLQELYARLVSMRSKTEHQLLALHGLERAWRTKQSEMDAVLAPFSPKSLYQRLGASVGEQDAVCVALEESFLESEGKASERELETWLKQYREERKLLHLRRERKERWDEGRVGGWR